MSRFRSCVGPALTTLLFVAAPMALGQDAGAIELLRTTPTAGGGQAYSLTLQALGLMTLLTLLPAIVLSMTAFTRIVIVLGLLRQAIGTASTPPNQVIVGLALFLTFFVMAPTLDEVQRVASDFKIYFKKVSGSTPTSYTMDHSAASTSSIPKAGSACSRPMEPTPPPSRRTSRCCCPPPEDVLS